MNENVLVLSPHTDDGELGCGGFISKLCDEGKKVYYIAFSAAEKSVPSGLPKNILRTEVKEATACLGIKKENLIILDYEVRVFPENRQSILEDLIKIKKEINPGLVLLPSIRDIHQDHRTVSMEGIRAFKGTTILGYELPWNNLNISTKCFVKLTGENLRHKIEALNCYKSQSGRAYFDEDFIKGLALTRGTQIGSKYAEVYEVYRLIFE